ncbi:MAG: hypothetical protein LBM38_00635 [Clostridiales bacterium]|jgi:nicotinate phosphoribosyltransferase|nr:hypothetical protein [Clostridiales bacterium]
MEKVHDSKLNFDRYNLLMANAMIASGLGDRQAHFYVTARKNAPGSTYNVTGGLRYMIHLLANFEPTQDDIDYLKHLPIKNETIDKICNFKQLNKLNIDAMPEGTISFKNNPLMRISGPAWQATLIEQMANNPYDALSIIATNASHMVYASKGKQKFTANSARRFATLDSAPWGERAAYIGGFDQVSWERAGAMFRSIPAFGTMGHLLIQFFGTSYDAFKSKVLADIESTEELAERTGEKVDPICSFLVDTYSTFKEGIPALLRVQKEVLEPLGYKLGSVRIDSGDSINISNELRKILDENGLQSTKIVDSNDVTYNKIVQIESLGAPIDAIGSGAATVDNKGDISSVCKITAVERVPGVLYASAKASEYVSKATLPGIFQPYRIYNNDGKIMTHYTNLDSEGVPTIKSIDTLYDPENPNNSKVLTDKNVSAIEPLFVPIYRKGELVYDIPESRDVRAYCLAEQNKLHDEYRIVNGEPKITHNISNKLYNLQKQVIAHSKEGDVLSDDFILLPKQATKVKPVRMEISR